MSDKQKLTAYETIGGIIGATVLGGAACWWGYHSGETFNDFLEITNTYGRAAMDYALICFYSIPGGALGLGFGAGAGMAAEKIIKDPTGALRERDRILNKVRKKLKK